jgi:4-amino-4-deoxy-L-arabinose transferase-like glycosyltransferase
MPKTKRKTQSAKLLDPPPLQRRPGPWGTAVVLGIFAAVFTALELVSYTQMSATWDEPGHLLSGYAALTRGDYRIDTEHPPLLRLWAALPLVAMRGIRLDTAAIDRSESTNWAMARALDFTHRFMYVDNDADRLLYAARLMIVLLGVLLGILLYCWVNEWFGATTAVIVLAFYSIEPNIAAHSALVTTDVGSTCFMFGAVYFLWRALQRTTTLNLSGLVAFFALAVASKFSALILGPIVAVLLALGVFGFRRMRVATALGILTLLALGSWMAVWAAYGFRYAPSASSGWLFHFYDSGFELERVPALANLVRWIDGYHLLPNAFSEGFLHGQAMAQKRGAFLAGSYRIQGWWYYFPVAFLLKTPVAAIALALGGLIVYFKRWGLGERTAFVLVPIAVYLAAVLPSNINIGLRHILPIYPFVLALVAGAVSALLAARGAIGRTTLALLALVWVIEFGRAYPHNLAFFNELAGGPKNGFKYLADSNVDWGQELKGLKSWMDRNGVAHISLAYFGTADPGYYHISCTYLPDAPFFVPPEAAGEPPGIPGYVAISATTLDGVYQQRPGLYEPLRDREPAAVIGNAIFVYWIDRPWWPQ